MDQLSSPAAKYDKIFDMLILVERLIETRCDSSLYMNVDLFIMLYAASGWLLTTLVFLLCFYVSDVIIMNKI